MLLGLGVVVYVSNSCLAVLVAIIVLLALGGVGIHESLRSRSLGYQVLFQLGLFQQFWIVISIEGDSESQDIAIRTRFGWA